MKTLLITITLLLSTIILHSQEDYDHTLDSITKNKTLKEQFKSVSNEVKKYNSKSLDVRLFYSRALIDIANITEDALLMGSAYYELAYSYEIIGQYDLAIEACFKALEQLEKINNQHLIAMTYNEIGMIYSSRNNVDELDIAIEYFNKFLKIQLERGDTGEIAGAYSNIGLMYIYKKIGDSAYYYSKLALDLRQEINQKRSIPISLGNVGISLYYLGQKDSALFYYQQAEDVFNSMDNLYGLNENYRNFITYYLDAKDYSNVNEYVNKYFENSKIINSVFTTKVAYLGKYEYSKAIGDFENALLYYETYKNLSDSINNDRVINRIANIEAVYSLDKKEKEIELYIEREISQKQITENRKQRFIYLSILWALLVIVFGIITYSLIRKRKQEKHLRELEIHSFMQEKELTKSELEKSKLKEQKLSTQLTYKSKQLTSHALNMMKKNKFLQELEGDITEIRKEANDEVKSKLRRLNTLVKRNNKSDKDWELFKNYFEEVNQGFYVRLNIKFPGLSSNDYKLCALIKLNMNIKESASVLNISPESVKTARYRLRKKLEMKAEEDLHEFIQII